MSQDFHRFAVNVDDREIAFILDGVQRAALDISGFPEFQQPFYILLASQVGSRVANWVPAPDAGMPDVSDMLVRSVRAWQYPGPLGIDLSQTAYLDDLAAGGAVAALSSPVFGAASGLAYSVVDDPDAMFAVSGSTLTLRQAVPALTQKAHAVRLAVTDSLGRSRQRQFKLDVVTAAPGQPNLITAQAFDAPLWTAEGGTASDGGIAEDASNGNHGLVTGLLARAAAATTMNAWIEVDPASSRPWVHMMAFDGAYNESAQAWFDVAGRAVGYFTQGGRVRRLRALPSPPCRTASCGSASPSPPTPARGART